MKKTKLILYGYVKSYPLILITGMLHMFFDKMTGNNSIYLDIEFCNIISYIFFLLFMPLVSYPLPFFQSILDNDYRIYIGLLVLFLLIILFTKIKSIRKHEKRLIILFFMLLQTLSLTSMSNLLIYAVM